ncbi:MAG: hypothetical protein QXX08_02505 [Candidatus Bathyarchaeia archaeon]
MMVDRIKKFEGITQRRLDKDRAKDFLDGTTIGDLIDLSKQLTQFMKDDLVIAAFTTLFQHRNMLEHPIEKMENDIDEETFNKLSISLDLLEKTLLK